MSRYEAVKPPRFVVETVDGAEQVRIRAQRSWTVLLFLAFWLTLWTAGGVAALWQLFNDPDETFLLVWLIGWAAGWLFAAAVIAWQLGGAEILRTVGGDLEIGYGLAGFRRRRLYRGSDIRGLAPAAAADLLSRMYAAYPPFLNWTKSGSIKFNYGAWTIYAASGLDEAEGRLIVEHLRRRLPASAAQV